MTKFIAAFEDFFKSIYELFASIIGTFASLVNTLITTVLNFFSGIINLFLDVGKGAVDLVGGIGKFIAGKSNKMPCIKCPKDTDCVSQATLWSWEWSLRVSTSILVSSRENQWSLRKRPTRAVLIMRRSNMIAYTDWPCNT